MEYLATKFSRPLVLPPKDEEYITIYGFITPSDFAYCNPTNIDHYCGYLAALHCYFNGLPYFVFCHEYRGLPDMMDRKTGVVHTHVDDWTIKVGKKSMKKIGLTYTNRIIEINEDDYSNYLFHSLIVSNDFFNRVDAEESISPFDESQNDDLPF